MLRPRRRPRGRTCRRRGSVPRQQHEPTHVPGVPPRPVHCRGWRRSLEAALLVPAHLLDRNQPEQDADERHDALQGHTVGDEMGDDEEHAETDHRQLEDPARPRRHGFTSWSMTPVGGAHEDSGAEASCTTCCATSIPPPYGAGHRHLPEPAAVSCRNQGSWTCLWPRHRVGGGVWGRVIVGEVAGCPAGWVDRLGRPRCCRSGRAGRCGRAVRSTRTPRARSSGSARRCGS